MDSVANHSQPVNDRPQIHWMVFDLVFVIDHKDEFLSLIGADGLIGHKQGWIFSAAGHSETREEPRSEQTVRIREYAAGAQGAGIRVQAVVHKVNDAVMGKTLLIGEPELAGNLRLTSADSLSFAGQLLIF